VTQDGNPGGFRSKEHPEGIKRRKEVPRWWEKLEERPEILIRRNNRTKGGVLKRPEAKDERPWKKTSAPMDVTVKSDLGKTGVSSETSR